MSPEGWMLLCGALATLAWVLLAVLAALLERSGPIRLRHWAQEAGPPLRRLYERAAWFEAYRFVLSLCARLALAGAFGLLAGLLVEVEVSHPFLTGFTAVFLLAAALELINRFLVRRYAEDALRRLTALFSIAFWLVRPLLPLIAAILPAPLDEEEEEVDEASRAEIEAFIDVGRREGILEATEGELIKGVVEFGDTQVRSVMTPRIDMRCAPLGATVAEVAELAIKSGHSRIPVFQGSIDEIVGILHVRDLLRLVVRSPDRPIAEVLQPPHFVPETKTLTQLLRELQERHQEVAVVVDEYGGTQGMVTVEDLLEEIFGEMGDSVDGIEPAHVKLADGSWRVGGRTHLEELEDLVGVSIENEEFETVGGLIFGHLGHVPRVGDVVESHGLLFLVEGADHRRARRVRVERKPQEAMEEEAGLV